MSANEIVPEKPIPFSVNRLWQQGDIFFSLFSIMVATLFLCVFQGEKKMSRNLKLGIQCHLFLLCS